MNLSRLRQATFATWVALAVTALAAVTNVAKLVLNSQYAIGYPDVQSMLVDPVTGFIFGTLIVVLAVLLVRGLLARRVWPAVLAAVIMPFLYLLMLDGLAAAAAHQEAYFALRLSWSFAAEVAPACFLVAVFGVEAVHNLVTVQARKRPGT